jgi:hypothetical protein
VSDFSGSTTQLFEPLLREEPRSLHDEQKERLPLTMDLCVDPRVLSFVRSSGAMAFARA